MKNKSVLLVAVWICLLCISRLLKFSIPMGEQSAHLVCFSVVLPLIAYFFPSKRSLFLVGGGWLLMHLVHPIPLTAGIPTLLATLSWRASSKKGSAHFGMHVLFPIAAMILFALAPAGFVAWPYSLYWLIPLACAFARPNVYVRALQSTFVAHAAGSVMWAYFSPITSTQWLALIPVVAVERLLATLLSVAVIGALASVTSPFLIRNRIKKLSSQ